MAVVALSDAAFEADGRQTAPWWTEADDAELAELTWELVDGIFTHRERCASCARGRTDGVPCPHIARAVEVVTDWIHARRTRSYARWVRHQRDLIELEEDRIVHRLRAAR